MRKVFLGLSNYYTKFPNSNRQALISDSSRTQADRARQVLGWSPQRGEEDFISEIHEVVAAMYDEKIKSG